MTRNGTETSSIRLNQPLGASRRHVDSGVVESVTGAFKFQDVGVVRDAS